MDLPLRFRLSLLVRMGVAAAVLVTFSLVVAGIVSVIGAFLGLAALGTFERVFEAVAALPRLSAATSIPASLVAGAAVLGFVVVLRGWGYSVRYTPEEYLIQPRHPVTWVFGGAALWCLYLAVVEGSVAVVAALTAVVPPVGGLLLLLGVSALGTCYVTVAETRREVARIREEMVGDSTPAAETCPEAVSMARRLARLADVPSPGVYVTDSARPESFTIGTGTGAVVVVSTGLLDVLSADELEAVLAHEISHLANGDSRLMGAALVPVLIADDLIEEDPSDPRDLFWNVVFTPMKWYGQFGVAVLSRGREWGADAGAVALTGAPAAFAAALDRLDDARGTPRADLREWERAVSAIDILPPADGGVRTGPFDTHPPTSDRIEWLQRRAARAETR